MYLHIGILILTIVVYVILSYTRSDKDQSKSNLIMTGLTPIILYAFNYFYVNSIEEIHVSEHISESLMSDIYPASSSSSGTTRSSHSRFNSSK
jgi:ABC-type protease/lipase transport system fused ATPase/permease subunit